MPSIAEGLDHPPPSLRSVPPESWTRLRAAFAGAQEAASFDQAWENGEAFLHARDGLRDRRPLVVEWKGPARPVGYEFLPADLRVDHVYLISCKYRSRVLFNPSPAHLFDFALGERPPTATQDWFGIAPVAYQSLYDAIRAQVGGSELPPFVTDLDIAHRRLIREAVPAPWSGELRDAYRALSHEVSAASCARWEAQLPTLASREVMLWRLLRFASAPYFVLGTSGDDPMQFRVATPWDWRQLFRLASFELEPRLVGQPTVDWRADVRDRATGAPVLVAGHVEIRWSHGRFSTVEAKVYLDTPHHEVPGYFPLE